jgi:hypothetical protein
MPMLVNSSWIDSIHSEEIIKLVRAAGGETKRRFWVVFSFTLCRMNDR